jgi:hypothetical protein
VLGLEPAAATVAPDAAGLPGLPAATGPGGAPAEAR